MQQERVDVKVKNGLEMTVKDQQRRVKREKGESDGER